MGRELFIVSRDRPDLFRYLIQTFANADNVQIIWDRRASDLPAATNHERRSRPEVDEDLKKVGYAFVVLD